MKNIRFLKYASLLVILPLFGLLSCGGGGDTSMNNRPNQNNQSNTRPNPQEETFPDETTAAKKGLETFAKLVDGENFRDLGFESAEEVKTATLGTPIKVFLVKLDQLRDYQPRTDPKTLLTDIKRTIFPVLAGGQARSSVTVEGQNGKWKPVSYGDAGAAKKIVELTAPKRPPILIKNAPTPPPKIRKADDKKAASPEIAEDKEATEPEKAEGLTINPSVLAEKPILVHVAFLNLYFVGQTVNGKLMLTNATSLPNSRFAETSTMQADQVFALLVPMAQAYNGLPM